MNIETFKKPFRNIIIKDFLPEKDSLKILNELKKEDFELKESDLFKLRQTKELISTDNKALKEFFDFISRKDFLEFLEDSFSVKLNGKLTASGTLYKNTDYLLPHDDRLEGRKIAFIFYLSTLKKRDGGEFISYNSLDGIPLKIAKKFNPTFNSLILFKVSKDSFHSISEVLKNKKRYAISGWFY